VSFSDESDPLRKKMQLFYDHQEQNSEEIEIEKLSRYKSFKNGGTECISGLENLNNKKEISNRLVKCMKSIKSRVVVLQLRNSPFYLIL
jgi:ubiquinone biosynthesis protein Coq4